MTIKYDEKGKIYTDIIAKEPVQARIQTTFHLIEGEVYVRLGGRLKDDLDLDEPFLAVTNATVFDGENGLLFRTKFIAVRRDQVIWITTIEEIQGEEKS